MAVSSLSASGLIFSITEDQVSNLNLKKYLNIKKKRERERGLVLSDNRTFFASRFYHLKALKIYLKHILQFKYLEIMSSSCFNMAYTSFL